MKVRGFQVAPAELEAHLLLHPSVGDACVVGVPDEYSGELPLAFVVPTLDVSSRIKRGDTTEVDVKQAIAKVEHVPEHIQHSALTTSHSYQHVSDAKIHYKWLMGGVEFIDAIPKNPSGKIVSFHVATFDLCVCDGPHLILPFLLAATYFARQGKNHETKRFQANYAGQISQVITSFGLFYTPWLAHRQG